MCLEERHTGGLSGFIAGRVRDQVYTVALRSTLKKDPILTEDIIKSNIRVAAEQVSGNLF
jgi:hypothetical protein